jgi:shikimate kinase
MAEVQKRTVQSMDSISLPKSRKRIYLTGFMGSGKSTVGPLLAKRLDWSFSDLDERIVNVIHMPIARFFQEEGEAAFRRIETERLQATQGQERLVMAVGGGALCSEANLQWALEHGMVIYLNVPVNELVRRLKEEQVTRPMLLDERGTVMNDEEVTRRITSLLQRREVYYGRAHATMECAGRSPGILAERIERIVTARR